jgi:hypothetical protein
MWTAQSNTKNRASALIYLKERIMIKDTLLAIIIGALGALILIEWMAGCGETYTDSKGKVHQETCVFVKGGV